MPARPRAGFLCRMCRRCAHLPGAQPGACGHLSSRSAAPGVYLPSGADLPPASPSGAVEFGGRDPDLRPPRLESFVLRPLYGRVSLNARPKSVFVPCLGSEGEGSRPRGYITLRRRSASLNTTQSGEAQPSAVRVSGSDPGL